MKFTKQRKKATYFESIKNKLNEYATVIFRDGFFWLVGILDACAELAVEIITNKIFKIVTGIIFLAGVFVFAILLLQIWLIESSPWLQSHITLDFIIYNASAAIINAFVFLFKGVLAIISVFSSGNFSAFKKLTNPGVPFLSIRSIQTVAKDIGQCHTSISGTFTVLQKWVQFYAGRYICVWDQLLWPTILHDATTDICSTFYKGTADPHKYGTNPNAACAGSSKHTLGEVVCLVLTSGELGLLIVSIVMLIYLLATPKTIDLVLQILKPIQFLYV